MIPLKDYNPTRTTPVVTIALIGACIAVFVFLQGGSRNSVNANAGTREVEDLRFNYSHAAVPQELTQRRPLSDEEVDAQFRSNAASRVLCESRGTDTCYPHKNIWLSVLYSMFLHGSWLHLGGNMLFLWIFGNNIEDREGKLTYLAFYVLAGVIATVAQVSLSPHSALPMIGASGAIAGVMGAYLVLYPNVRIRTLFIFFLVLLRDVEAKWLLLFWFATQFLTSPSSGVAWMAHVGGFAFGVLAGLVWKVTGRGGPTRRPARPIPST